MKSSLQYFYYCLLKLMKQNPNSFCSKTCCLSDLINGSLPSLQNCLTCSIPSLICHHINWMFCLSIWTGFIWSLKLFQSTYFYAKCCLHFILLLYFLIKDGNLDFDTFLFNLKKKKSDTLSPLKFCFLSTVHKVSNLKNCLTLKFFCVIFFYLL